MPATLLVLALALAADPRAQLEALRQRRAAEEAAARALQQREGSLLSVVHDAEQAWIEADAGAREAEEEHARAEEQLARARHEEAAAQARFQTLQGTLAPRLLARARMGRLSELRVLVGSSSLADLVKRWSLWNLVVAHDLAVLRDSQRALVERERARTAFAREAAREAALAQDARDRRASAAELRQRHRALLAAIRGAATLHQRAAAEAAAQERKLAEFVAALPPTRSGPGAHAGFSLLRGRLPHPVAGTIEAGFGRVVEPRFKTVTAQNGIDIRAAAGSTVRAVAAGTVAYAGWFKGYGNLVIVDHGDGYHTLVAHLASMSTAMGEDVEGGTLLGTVGDTGSLKGTYLYFEVREHGRPVDPRAWLRP